MALTGLMSPKGLWQRRNSGQQGEHLAETFLKQQGLQLVMRNFRHAVGEIDLVMRDGETLVFVEVRLRRHLDYTSASESITRSKQQKIIRTASAYLQQHDPKGQFPCRFDVIALSSLDAGITPVWIKNAFDAV